MLLMTHRMPWPRLLFGLLLLSLLCLRGAQAQQTVLRIGLQTGKTEVRLQAGVPVRVAAGGAAPVLLPANQVLIARLQEGRGVLLDPANAAILTFTGPVMVSPEPPREAGGDPYLRLLGPTRHYDGKPDRPYRGAIELLLRNGGLTVVNLVGMEEYLLGVVSSEMRPDYPLEALKAQAVAARTYALKNRGRLAAQGFDLDDTAACQVYGGLFSEDPRTTRAVQDTAGMVLTYDGKPIDAVYSSTCGGYTESAQAAWGRTVPYLVSVPDFQGEIDTVTPRPADEAAWAAYCKHARAVNCLQPAQARVEAFRWVKLITRAELEAGLTGDTAVGTLKEIVPLERGDSGRITRLRLVGSARSVEVTGELAIRRVLGKLRSSAFTVESYRDDAGTPVVFAFWGAGWGHGLGMCQVGAVGLANQGWTYDAILTHYYRGAKVEAR